MPARPLQHGPRMHLVYCERPALPVNLPLAQGQGVRRRLTSAARPSNLGGGAGNRHVLRRRRTAARLGAEAGKVGSGTVGGNRRARDRTGRSPSRPPANRIGRDAHNCQPQWSGPSGDLKPMLRTPPSSLSRRTARTNPGRDVPVGVAPVLLDTTRSESSVKRVIRGVRASAAAGRIGGAAERGRSRHAGGRDRATGRCRGRGSAEDRIRRGRRTRVGSARPPRAHAQGERRAQIVRGSTMVAINRRRPPPVGQACTSGSKDDTSYCTSYQ